MRIAIIGAGPGGLYLAYLLRRARPDWGIEILEQNAPDTTFGFGLAFSKMALDFLEKEDTETLAAILPAMRRWSDSVLFLNGERIRIDGMDYAGIGRLKLLEILTARAESVGIAPQFGRRIESFSELGNPDLIVGADGANSILRRAHETAFGTTQSLLTNRFAWYGTRKEFGALCHTFIETPRGFFNAHHHPHAQGMSTFVVEMDEATFLKNGFDTMPLEKTKPILEDIFGETLGGEPLISNNSIWRRFPKIRSTRAFYGNCVLLGDALHTAHFSIGSGTRLALEDAIALAHAVLSQPDLSAALAAYESARLPRLEKLLAAADASAQWYENFPAHMRLAPLDFAYSYITRSGRVDLNRLRQSSPEFAAAYETRISTGKAHP